MNKVARDIVRRLERQGWRVEVTGGGHLKCIPPKGPFIIMAATPSDTRSSRNAVARLRRAGADV